MDQHPKLPRLRTELQRELAGTALLFGAVFVAGALLSAGSHPDAHCWAAGARFGPIGSCLRSASFGLVGPLPAALLVLAPLVAAAHVIRRIDARESRALYEFLGGFTLLLSMAVALTVGVAAGVGGVRPRAGLFGALMAVGLSHVLGVIGTWLVVLLALYALSRFALHRAGFRVATLRRRRRPPCNQRIKRTELVQRTA